MELYLIRHGETVDNVAGLYAGVRDSALTNHGIEQARRLGQHFAKNATFTHIFSSPLSRAFKTAQAIRAAQSAYLPVEIVQASELIEQDFGYYEGKPFHARSDPKKTGREAHRGKHKEDAGFVDVETKASMNARANCFLNEHLVPLLNADNAAGKQIVAIVSHGMLLSHLWRMLLLRLPANSITVNPEITAVRGNLVLQHLGGWSNTGYLDLALTKTAKEQMAKDNDPKQSYSSPSSVTIHSEASQHETAVEGNTLELHHVDVAPAMLAGWSTLIRAIDRKDHLTGLKRQRGGIGRSAFDEGQRKLDGFFKRQRTG